MGLLTEIQRDIINPSISTAATLRKAQILAYQLNNPELKNWVDWELNGYPTQEKEFETFINKIPSYRKTRARILCNMVGPFGGSMENAPVLIPHLPDEHTILWIAQGIPSLERLIEGEGDVVKEHWPDYMIKFLNEVSDNPDWYCVEAWKVVPKSFVVGILETVRDRLLKFTLELKQTYPELDNTGDVAPNQIQPEQVSQLVVNIINQGATMSTFDQRGQSISGNQYNAAKDINFTDVQTPNELLVELVKLQAQVDSAIQTGSLTEEAATDAEYHLKKAIQQTKKPEPEKSSILSHLNQFKTAIIDVAGLVTATVGAIEAVDKIF